MQPLSDIRGVENSRRHFLSDPDTFTGILMKGSDQMAYDVRHAFAAKCFPEGCEQCNGMSQKQSYCPGMQRSVVG